MILRAEKFLSKSSFFYQSTKTVFLFFLLEQMTEHQESVLHNKTFVRN